MMDKTDGQKYSWIRLGEKTQYGGILLSILVSRVAFGWRDRHSQAEWTIDRNSDTAGSQPQQGFCS